MAMDLSANVQPVALTATKDVFISAIRFAMSIDCPPCPPFGDELKMSAQEQVEYMLGDGEEMSLVTLDGDVQSETKLGLSNICSTFGEELSAMLLHSDITNESLENKIMQCLSDLDWICRILPKMNLMKDFVVHWAELSSRVLNILDDEKLDAIMWGLKVKLIELTTKVLEAVGYGSVIVPAHCRLQLLKTWLPFIRKIKPLLDSMRKEDNEFPYKMDEDLCQSIEGATTSLILALPSNDQAEIFMDWMNTGHVLYPDLSEAFELWCYRTKSAKRRLVAGADQIGNACVNF